MKLKRRLYPEINYYSWCTSIDTQLPVCGVHMQGDYKCSNLNNFCMGLLWTRLICKLQHIIVINIVAISFYLLQVN